MVLVSSVNFSVVFALKNNWFQNVSVADNGYPRRDRVRVLLIVFVLPWADIAIHRPAAEPLGKTEEDYHGILRRGNQRP